MKNSTKLKVAIVLDDSLDRIENGVQQYVLTLGSWLESEGHTVHYMAGNTTNSPKTVHSLSRNIAVRFNQNRMTIPLPANKAAIKRLLESEKYDVLHIQMPYSPFMAGMVISAAQPSIAVVGTFHIVPFGRLQQTGSKALAVAQKATLRRFDAICSVSPAAAEFAKSHFGVKSVVIPNMIDLSRWKSKLSPHPKRIIYLGRLVPRKGCHELLKALAKLPYGLRSQTEVLIASDGPERDKLEKFAHTHDLRNVAFLGFVTEQTKVDLLATAELAIFPSLGGESFGIVLIEAMAAGAGVVIGGNNVGYASVLGSIPGSLVNPKDSVAFAKTIQHFLADARLLASVHQKQQKVVQEYDVHVAGPKILELYRTALLHSKKDVP